MADVKTLVIQVPPEKHAQLKLLAITRRMTLKKLLMSAIDELPLNEVQVPMTPPEVSADRRPYPFEEV